VKGKRTGTKRARTLSPAFYGGGKRTLYPTRGEGVEQRQGERGKGTPKIGYSATFNRVPQRMVPVRETRKPAWGA